MEPNGMPAAATERAAYVCACMKVTHADLVEAAACPQIRTLADLRRQTGAGDGCMACHRRLRCYLAAATQEAVASRGAISGSGQPICSVR